MKALVEIEKLLVRRAGKTVLTFDRLEIEQGRVTALVGPNGSGKTTLLLVLMRLLEPASGKIRFAGRPVEQIPVLDYRRRISLVMQAPLMLDRSVAENIALGLRFRRLSREETAQRVQTWLERLQIVHLRQRKATGLSGGEAQRVALARALVLQPELLLLDEPFQSLDRPAHAALVADLRSLLDGTRMTVLFSTHSRSDVRLLADRTIRLKDGALDPAAV
jgi:tungstate transport system ATP-binding protein